MIHFRNLLGWMSQVVHRNLCSFSPDIFSNQGDCELVSMSICVQWSPSFPSTTIAAIGVVSDKEAWVLKVPAVRTSQINLKSAPAANLVGGRKLILTNCVTSGHSMWGSIASTCGGVSSSVIIPLLTPMQYPHSAGRFSHRVNSKSDKIRARTTCTSELSPFISEYKGSQNQEYRYPKQYILVPIVCYNNCSIVTGRYTC